MNLVEGTTRPLNFQLLDDGSAVDLTGLVAGTDVTVVVKDKAGVASTVTGDIAIVTALTGKVRYTPDAVDFTAAAGPYTLRWKVIASDGTAYYPDGAAIPVTVYAE